MSATTDRHRALTKAREIIDQNPGASLTHLVALAWLQGRIEVCAELKPLTEVTFLDRADCCQRCGRKHRGACDCSSEVAA